MPHRVPLVFLLRGADAFAPGVLVDPLQQVGQRTGQYAEFVAAAQVRQVQRQRLIGAGTVCDTAAARRLSKVMRRMMRSSMAAQVSAMASSMAPTNQEIRVATMPSAVSTLRPSPRSVSW